MRAVLFFYTMDYSDTVLNLTSDTKKSFNDWYFKEHNSHLVYEYTKGESRFLFVVSKSAKLHYTFIDITNCSLGVKELFIDANMPLSLEKMNEKIQKENLPNHSTTIKERYINTFHRRDTSNKKIKQESVVDFSLFERINLTSEFAKTLSNIFISSKVNSSSIKKSIVSLIENSNAKIDLHEIKVNLDEYVSHKDEIEKFEKKIPTIEKLSQKFNEYSGNKKEFKQRSNELHALNSKTTLRLQEIVTEIDSIEDEKEKLKISYGVKITTIDEKIEINTKEINIQENYLKDLKLKDREYKEINIDLMVNEYQQEQSYINSLQDYRDRYEALTSESKNLTLQYKNIQERHYKDRDDEILKLKNENLETSKKINDEKNILIEGKERKIKEKTQRYIDEKDSLELNLKEQEARFNEIDIELARIEFFQFNKDEIGRYEDEIKKYDEALVGVSISTNNNNIEIKEVEKEIKEIAKELINSRAKLDSELKEQKEKLFAKKEMLEKKLDFEKDNLYGYLNKNSVKNREKIVTYLKDEILFSDKTFNIKDTTDVDSLFGIKIEFDKEFENEYEYSKLMSSLKLVKESIKNLNKEAIRKKQTLEDEASKNTKLKDKLRATLYLQKTALEEKKKSYLKNISLAKLNLDNEKQTASKDKINKITELQKQRLYCKGKKEEFGSKIDKLKIEIESVSKAISDDVESAIFDFKEQLKELKISLVSKIEDVKFEYAKKQEATQAELLEALKSSGIDETLLLTISQKIKVFSAKLKSIDKNKTMVMVYLFEYKDKIKTIPFLEEKFQSDSRYLSDLKHRRVEIQKDNELKVLELENKKQSFQSGKSEINSFIQNYKQKIQNHPIEKKIKESLTLNAYLLDDDVKITPLVVDEIIKTYDDIKSAQESIESSVLKIIQNIKHDNIFKIEIPNDFVTNSSYLKTAKELIEYISNDKLSLFKDVSLEKFKSNINYIKKQLNLFEDALLDIEGEVKNLRNGIKKAIGSFKVIDDIDIRFQDANSNIFNTLKSLALFYDNNNDKFLSGLFDSLSDDKISQRAREELREKIVDLVKLLNVSKEYLELENGFVLEFKAIERGNDLKWRQTLNDIGSTGTSTLVKSIINISMLKMVSKNIVKNSEIVTHCILDEIGTISTQYFKELKDFVNDNGFVFLNGMPTEDDMLMSMYPSIYVGQNFGKYSKMILASKMEI